MDEVRPPHFRCFIEGFPDLLRVTNEEQAGDGQATPRAEMQPQQPEKTPLEQEDGQ